MNPDWHAQMKPAILDSHCFSKLSNQDQHGKGQFINTLLDALFCCVLLANGEDPDEMLHGTEFHHGLHCLPR